MLKYKLIERHKGYLIINKPAGLLVHGAPHLKEETLTEQLLKNYPEIAKVGDDPWRPGLVHRIDKLASGLILVARNTEYFELLKKQFINRTIYKEYTALAFGKIFKDEGEINFRIARSNQGNKMTALPLTHRGKKTKEGRYAISKFWIIKRYINFTLLKISIKTGRTHQIRVHLAAYGHPLVGDTLYGTKKTEQKNKKINLGRIFLHAGKLKFKNKQGEEKTYELPLAPELKKFLSTLK